MAKRKQQRTPRGSPWEPKIDATPEEVARALVTGGAKPRPETRRPQKRD